MSDEIPGLLEGEGEALPVRSFSLEESIRLRKNPKVQRLIASLAAQSGRYIALRDLANVVSDSPLSNEAVDGLCAALDGHDEILVVLTALAADRTTAEVREMPAAEQAVLVLSMIAKNQSFFSRGMEKEYRRQMGRQPENGDTRETLP